MRQVVHSRRARAGIGVTACLSALLWALAGSAGAKTVWLCRPGLKPDPCAPGLSTTVYSPRLAKLRVTHPAAARNPRLDCFYVYPTVSGQKGPFANLQIDPEERSIALLQSARYSQYCRVYAPMYRQGTVPALTSEPITTAIRQQLTIPLADVRSAFQDYLRHDNHGRPFVVIAHSQGAILMDHVLAETVDPRPALRSRMLAAILLGANVLVKRGSDVGGDFKHIPACSAARRLHCVIAFSTFDQPPPANTLFGTTTAPGRAVLCVNPATLTGAAGLADPILPSQPFAPGTLIALGISLLHLTVPHPATTWVSEPGAYSVRCTTGTGPDVLEAVARDRAQRPTASPDPSWGLHLLDANLSLGNLLGIVRADSARVARDAGR